MQHPVAQDLLSKLESMNDLVVISKEACAALVKEIVAPRTMLLIDRTQNDEEKRELYQRAFKEGMLRGERNLIYIMHSILVGHIHGQAIAEAIKIEGIPEQEIGYLRKIFKILEETK